MLAASEDNAYLHEQLRKGENTYIDFKQIIHDNEKIARSIVAFANQKGGSLFIGVNDKGEIIGCEPNAEYHNFLNILDKYCQPTPIAECYVYTEDEIDVLEIAIEEGQEKPYAAKSKNGDWVIYLRIEDQCKKIGLLQ